MSNLGASPGETLSGFTPNSDLLETSADGFSVSTDAFEGPLHILLDLAQKQKVDLLHVSILQLAEQYLEFVQAAKSERIDLAAEYLLMAAWLTFLKSKLLLPQDKGQKPNPEEMTGEEMAAALSARLSRLDWVRRAGKILMDGPQMGQTTFSYGAPRRPHIMRDRTYHTTLWELGQAMSKLAEAKKRVAPHSFVKQMVLPLNQARDTLRDAAKSITDWQSLNAIQQSLRARGEEWPARSALASLFSATLELARDGELDLRQDVHFSPLFLRAHIDASDAQ